MKDINVTDKLSVTDWFEGEVLFVNKCICGDENKYRDFVIGDNEDSPSQCDNCKRKFYYKLSYEIFEVME